MSLLDGKKLNDDFRRTVALKYMTSARNGWFGFSDDEDQIKEYYNHIKKLDVDVKVTDFDVGSPHGAHIDNKFVTQDLVTTAEEADILSKTINLQDIKTITEIGVGYGRTASYLLRCFPNIEKYHLVDIHPAIKLAEEYLSIVLDKDLLSKIVFMTPDGLNEACRERVDLVLAISSLNEMTGTYVDFYLEMIDRYSHYFYHKNSNQHEHCALSPEKYNRKNWKTLYDCESRTTKNMIDRIYHVSNKCHNLKSDLKIDTDQIKKNIWWLEEND